MGRGRGGGSEGGRRRRDEGRDGVLDPAGSGSLAVEGGGRGGGGAGGVGVMGGRRGTRERHRFYDV